MKNLENYGVLEMDAREMSEVDGGLTGLEVLGIVAAAIAVGTAVDWCMGEFGKGWNNPK